MGKSVRDLMPRALGRVVNLIYGSPMTSSRHSCLPWLCRRGSRVSMLGMQVKRRRGSVSLGEFGIAVLCALICMQQEM